MNLCDAYTTKILSTPYQKYGKWWLDVEINCYGRISNTTIMQNTKEEIDKISIGYKVLV